MKRIAILVSWPRDILVRLLRLAEDVFSCSTIMNLSLSTKEFGVRRMSEMASKKGRSLIERY